MRWRGLAPDVLLATSGVALDLMMSGKAGGASAPDWLVPLFAVLVGAPMGLVRSRPVAVSLYLAAFLVFTDQIDAFASNTAQILLCVAIGAAGYLRGWGATVATVVAGALATGVNIADPGLAFTSGAWFYSAGIALLPALIGRYLRGPAGRLKEPELTPDVLLAGAGVAVAVLGTWPAWHTSPQPAWVIVSFVVLAGLALGVARRLPAAVFVIEGAVLLLANQELSGATSTVQVLMLIAVGVFAMRVASWFWNLVVYVAASSMASVVVIGSDTDVTALRVVLMLVVVATPIAIGRYAGASQSAAEAERLRVRESERLAIAQLRADQLAERERIAREVHDIVAHHVGAMVLRAGAARYAAPDGPVADALNDIKETGHQVLEDLRGLLDVLRDPGGDATLLADPADVVTESAERMIAAGLLVDLDVDPALSEAPLVARASAARIVQEGLTNVLKHAGPGTAVRVGLAAGDGELVVEVSNGRPPTVREPLPSSGQGLAGMRERAKALGGTLSAGPDAGGWRLSVTLPYPKPKVTT
ncbi:sensor histidine kinase [Nonomuraea africana]|uniref:histidine kinase n=1 Tax=Nonomuraea africana TaxID=46171 RepID=A0ABR9KEM1_9ACTN|nr:histidine kinase [Nonomuraea africana]MBE1560425.1 signal transduction histidine kinase [Nonomuraea africana]